MGFCLSGHFPKLLSWIMFMHLCLCLGRQLNFLWNREHNEIPKAVVTLELTTQHSLQIHWSTPLYCWGFFFPFYFTVNFVSFKKQNRPQVNNLYLYQLLLDWTVYWSFRLVPQCDCGCITASKKWPWPRGNDGENTSGWFKTQHITCDCLNQRFPKIFCSTSLL